MNRLCDISQLTKVAYCDIVPQWQSLVSVIVQTSVALKCFAGNMKPSTCTVCVRFSRSTWCSCRICVNDILHRVVISSPRVFCCASSPVQTQDQRPPTSTWSSWFQFLRVLWSVLLQRRRRRRRHLKQRSHLRLPPAHDAHLLVLGKCTR